MYFHFFVVVDSFKFWYFFILNCEKNIIEINMYNSAVLIIIRGIHNKGLIWGIQEY